nr:FAD-binding oxidoreductase [Geomicrobium sp. JCM 19055]
MSKYVVVGAGILGASTAYHLAKAGHDVTIVDRFDAGQATDAAAGIVSPCFRNAVTKIGITLYKMALAIIRPILTNSMNSENLRLGTIKLEQLPFIKMSAHLLKCTTVS